MSLREVCACGHDKATHYEKKHTCLGMACDCVRYRDENAPKEKDTVRSMPASAIDDDDRGRPHADGSCRCSACLDWLRRQRRLWLGFP